MKFEKIYSGSIDPEKQKEIVEEIEIENSEGDIDRLYDNEIEKSEKDIEVIWLWKDEIEKYFKNLGVEKDFYVNEDQIYFINDKDFFADGSFFGYFDVRADNIYVDGSREKYKIYKTILHEMIHMSAYKAAHVEKEKDIIDENKIGLAIYETRTGYDLGGDKMNSFNESITELITLDIFSKNSDFLKDELNLEKDIVFNGKDKTYEHEMNILNIIIEQISDTLDESKDNLLKSIKKGYFDGTMMHLRLVSKVYGKTFLKILANPDFIFENIDISDKEKEVFFSIVDEEKRMRYVEHDILKENNEKYRDLILRINSL